MTAETKSRLVRLWAWPGALGGGGLAYGAFVRATGWAVPCLFHAVTGLKCPGCGVTRMCLALLRLDLGAAWAANPGLMLALPGLGVLAVSLAWRYVTAGERKLLPWQSALAWTLTGALLAYGVIRNLVGV